MFQNNETAAMFVSQTSPVGVELFSLFVPIKSHRSGSPNDNFRENICSEDDLRSRIFEHLL